MKRILSLLIISILISGSVYSQQKEYITSLLTNKTWIIAEDMQSGVGQHKSLAEGATLIFNADGTWICSGLIDGVNKGRWSVIENKEIIITPGDKGIRRKFNIIKLDENTLRYKYKKLRTVTTHEWRKAG